MDCSNIIRRVAIWSIHTTTNLKASTSEGYDNVSTKLLKQTVKKVCMYKLYLMTVKPGYNVISPRAVWLVKISIKEQYYNTDICIYIHTDNN